MNRLALFLVLAILLASCTPSTATPAPAGLIQQTQATSPVEPAQPILPADPCSAPQNETQWAACEAALAQEFALTVKSESLTSQEIAELQNLWDSGQITLKPGVFDLDNGFQGVSTSKSEWLVPVIAASPQIAHAIDSSLQAVEPFASDPNTFYTAVWAQYMFHWTNHLTSAGVNIRNLAEAGAYYRAVIMAAKDGGGIIFFREATADLQAAYLYIGRVNGQIWAAVVSPSGAPITSYFTEKKDMVKAMAWGVNKGWTVVTGGDNVPDEIQNAWYYGVPPVLRFWWWSISYNVTAAAAATGTTLLTALQAFAAFCGSTITDFFFGIFVVPYCNGVPCFIQSTPIQGF